MQAMNDKVVIITGASSGIGEATARMLAARGARLMLAARREDRLEKIADSLGDTVAYQVTDVTQEPQVRALAEATLKRFGQIDVLVNNAGIMPLSFLAKGKVDEWNQMIDVNIKGVLYGIAAVLPHMTAQKSGHIINVASVAGHRVGPGSAVYSATKFAVRTLTEGLRQEVKPHRIRTTIISPGAVATELPNSISDPAAAERMNKLYDEVAIPADSFARAVVFAMEQPEDVDINEILYRPTNQAY